MNWEEKRFFVSVVLANTLLKLGYGLILITVLLGYIGIYFDTLKL